MDCACNALTAVRAVQAAALAMGWAEFVSSPLVVDFLWAKLAAGKDLGELSTAKKPDQVTTRWNKPLRRGGERRGGVGCAIYLGREREDRIQSHFGGGKDRGKGGGGGFGCKTSWREREDNRSLGRRGGRGIIQYCTNLLLTIILYTGTV